MARHWRDPNAFRADPADVAARPSRRQSAALLVILLLIAGAIATVSYVIRPERARAFDLFGGSIFLSNWGAPVAVDLATGSPSVRLIDATAQVGLPPGRWGNLGVVPLDPGGGTLLLNKTTGEFNMVDATGFVIKRRTGGVPIPPAPNSTAVGQPAHEPAAPDLAYIEQIGPRDTHVYLVGQATVRSADQASNAHLAAGSKVVTPRASTVIYAPGSAKPGASASADGHLWMLIGSGSQRRTIYELSLPTNSEASGATLDQNTHRTVSAHAAIGSAAAGPNAQQSVVGIADDQGIRVFPDHPRPAPYHAPPGLNGVLAATNQTGRLAFLVHGSNGWSLVSVGMDGKHLRGPTHIAIPRTAQLAPPAASGKALYTVDRNSGQLWRIRIGRRAQAMSMGDYPVVEKRGHPIEQSSWRDTYVIARDGRVFYDSPSHLNAVALFTDQRRRPPLVIQKNRAVDLNSVLGPSLLSRNPQPPPPPPLPATTVGPTPATPTSSPPPVGGLPPPQVTGGPTITNNINCQNAAQKPHIPQILPGWQAASTSVTLSWLYPRISNQDCIPRTYHVSARVVSGTDPRTTVMWPIGHAQTSATLTGLYPSSTYQVTVTAFLGSLSTTSQPITISTTKQGPNAPTNVSARPDSHGDWTLTWDSCGTAAPNCVPSTSWQIQPTVCDGQGPLGALAPITKPGDPTTRSQPPAVYHGSPALLGRGLSFQIIGTGLNNLPGRLSTPTSCTYSWTPPKASALKLTASTPSETAFGETTTADATLNLGADPVRDVGGGSAKVTFMLSGNGTTQTDGPIVVDASSRSTISTTFNGVTPGVQYTATASVQPAHGGPSVTLTAPPLSTRSAWPNYTTTAKCSQPQALLSCDLQINFAGISSAASRGEQFSLTNASQVRCNNTAQPLKDTGFDPGTSPVTATLSQLNGLYGMCQVTVQLVEDTSAGQPVFGGIPSLVQTVNVNLGPPAHANAGRGDFSVRWDPQGSSSVQVMYTGKDNLADLTTSWSETVTAPGGKQCGSAQALPGSTPASALLVPLYPACVNLYGAQPAPWTVNVQFTNRTDGTQVGPFTYQLPGPPPGYQPCDPKGLAAAWGATQAAGISVSLGPNAQINGCSQWSYALYDGNTTPPTQVCPASTNGVTGPPPLTLNTTQCGTPPNSSWFVRVSWVDTAGQPLQQDLQLGAPPPS